jgi:septum formation protein
VEQVEKNSRRKGELIASRHPSSLVIASDTTVALGRRVLGKPGSEQEAIDMLLALSGKTHRVVTGVFLGWGGETSIFHDSSEVTFQELDTDRIRLYLERVHVMDKAGAYGIQEHGDLIIQRYTGSFENIMGLPIQRLWQELVQLGWTGSLRPEL